MRALWTYQRRIKTFLSPLAQLSTEPPVAPRLAQHNPPQVGGGAGDAAVEFLDVREAALVSVTEALARKALPWQAQLCPRALQDLEIERVRVRDIFDGAQEGYEVVEWERADGMPASFPLSISLSLSPTLSLPLSLSLFIPLFMCGFEGLPFR